MLREHNKIFRRIHKAWDIFLTAAAFGAAYVIKKYFFSGPLQGLSTLPNYYILLLLSIIVWYVVFEIAGFYQPYRKRTFFEISGDIIKALAVNFFILASFLFIFKIHGVSRIFIGLFFMLNFSLLLASKWFVYLILGNIRKRGLNTRYILIAGCNERVREIGEDIRKRRETGYRIIGCLTTNENDINDSIAGEISVLGSINELNKIMTLYTVDELIIAEPLRKIKDVAKYINEAENQGVTVHILPEWGVRQSGFIPKIGDFKLDDFLGTPTLSLFTTPSIKPDILIKYAFDYIISGILMVFFSIPFLVIAIMIKSVSKGPVFFKQERVGLNGRKFTLYKFRTMAVGAENRKTELMSVNESDGPVFKIKKDPRIIPYVGTFLRKTFLDELPQLVNILKGEMSLVGPRPPEPGEVNLYDFWQRRRLSMKPGMTCIWQTSHDRNEITFNDWVRMDLEYIDNWSLKLDFKLLYKTAIAVFMGNGR